MDRRNWLVALLQWLAGLVGVTALVGLKAEVAKGRNSELEKGVLSRETWDDESGVSRTSWSFEILSADMERLRDVLPPGSVLIRVTEADAASGTGETA